MSDQALKRRCEARLSGLRTNRYSFWVHWRELADFFLPRRYRWLVTANLQSRGSPINQHIIDSTGTLAARNLAAGIMFGVSDPARPWFAFEIGHMDSTQTTPVSLWLAECERLLRLVFQESNFYTALATQDMDLVIFGTAPMLMYEDFENVICCYNPCAGEYFVENSSSFEVNTFYREFTLTVSQLVEQFGLENCSPSVRQLYQGPGNGLSNEVIVAHAIEPNTDPGKYGIAREFKYREVYWESGGLTGQQNGAFSAAGLLRKRGFYEQPFTCPRWDLVSNDSYGRSPAMDALGDVKQIQVEVRRKAQAIDKMVNPPMIADIAMKNQPASMLPGGVTYIPGLSSSSKPGFAPAYQFNPPVKEMTEDLMEVRERVKETFFNNLFQVISQYQTRSNVSATEIDARRAESMIMLGPVLTRVNKEQLSVAIERAFAICARNGVFPPPPPEIAGQAINIKYVSMLSLAQAASSTGGIERMLSLAGNIAALDPAIVDNIDFDYAFDKYSHLLNNDPKMIRSPEELASIRQRREQEKAQQQAMEQGMAAVQGAKVLSETDAGGGKNLLQQIGGVR